VPVTVAGAAEIENLVTITDTPPSRLLLDRAGDDVRSTWQRTPKGATAEQACALPPLHSSP
jgi:hypothetical protein